MVYYANDHFEYPKYCYTNIDLDRKKIETYVEGDKLPNALGERLSLKNPHLVTTSQEVAFATLKKRKDRENAWNKKLKPKVVPKKTTKKYTEKELYDLTKAEQIDMLKKLGYGGKTPRYQKDRVNVLMGLI